MHEPVQPVERERGEQVLGRDDRAGELGGEVAARCRGEVQHGLDVAQGIAPRSSLAQVAAHDGDPTWVEAVRGHRIVGRRADERDHVVSMAQCSVDDGTAEEPGRTGDEHLHDVAPVAGSPSATSRSTSSAVARSCAGVIGDGAPVAIAV